MSKSRITPVAVGTVPPGISPELWGKVVAALQVEQPVAAPAAPLAPMPRVQSDAPAKARTDGKPGPSPIQIVAVLGRVENRAAVEFKHTDPSHPFYTAKRCFGILPANADLSKIVVGSTFPFAWGTESYPSDKLDRAVALNALRK